MAGRLCGTFHPGSWLRLQGEALARSGTARADATARHTSRDLILTKASGWNVFITQERLRISGVRTGLAFSNGMAKSGQISRSRCLFQMKTGNAEAFMNLT